MPFAQYSVDRYCPCSSAATSAAATLFNSGEAKFALRVSSSLVACRRIGFGRQNASFLWPPPHGFGGSGSKRRARGPVMTAAKKASDGGIKEEGKYKHTRSCGRRIRFSREYQIEILRGVLSFMTVHLMQMVVCTWVML